jgi:hypothetical protein
MRVLLGLLCIIMSIQSYAICNEDEFLHEKSRQLSKQIESSIKRKFPFTGWPIHRVFRNSYDPHSSIHAHWALFSIARYQQDQEKLEWLKSRLNERVLERILKKTIKRQQKALKWEEPYDDWWWAESRSWYYGNAWMLFLLSEIEQQNYIREDLIKELEDVVVSIIHHQLDRAGEMIVRGNYLGPAFYFYALKENGHEIPQLFLDKFANSVRRNAVYIPSDEDFLDIPSFWQAVYQGDLISSVPVSFPASLNDQNVHRPGLIITKTWNPSVTTCEESKQIISKYESMREKLERNQFANVDHWIPQFIWMGLVKQYGI